MLLAIDIGNTQTVLGLFEGEHLCHTWRLESSARRTADELGAVLTGLFRSSDIGTPLHLATVIIASVVPAALVAWCELARRLTGADALLVGPALTGGLTLAVDNPTEVGADRIANAVAARALYSAPAIVVDFGTATNIDVVDANGAYAGGIISPGLQTSASALFTAAARLPVLELGVPPRLLGTTTETAVQSGLLYGEAAKVDGLLAGLFAEMPKLADAALSVIATGGLAPLVAPLVTHVTCDDPDLTLQGLRLIAETATADTTLS